MLNRFINNTSSCIAKTPVVSIRKQILFQGIHRNFSMSIIGRSFGTVMEGSGNGNRNILGFRPCLNNFIAQYTLTSDKQSILKKLYSNSEKYGFSVLTKSIGDFLMDTNPTNKINLYCMLIIATIQVKDDNLLTYVLSDIDHYLFVDSTVLYDVMKRVCHYRKYSQFISFIQSYFESHPEMAINKELCELSLYLASKDIKDNRDFAEKIWTALYPISPTNKEEEKQRETDLSHLLSVYIRQHDWASCSLKIKQFGNEINSVSLIHQMLKGISQHSQD